MSAGCNCDLCKADREWAETSASCYRCGHGIPCQIAEEEGAPCDRFRLGTLRLSEARAACTGPFRAPHYTAPRGVLAGELLLSVGGMLYLDQLEDFRRAELQSLAWYARETPAAVWIVTSPRPDSARASDCAAWDRAQAILANPNPTA